ncbi:MAG: dihydrolipoamide acetyltransferase family protein [Nonlabens sp.]
MTDFVVPKMGESITEGTILNWLVQEGASFEEGDILVEIATDKVDNEVPAPCDGVLVSITAGDGEVVAIGSSIAVIEERTAGEGKSRIQEVNENQAVQQDKEARKPLSGNVVGSNHKRNQPTSRVSDAIIQNFVNHDLFVSPLVDSIARANHLSYEELARIPATGGNGRLRKSDVVNYLNNGRPHQFAQPAPAIHDETAYRIPQLKLDKGTGRIVEMDRMRSMIADHMVYSKHTSPHVTAYVETDLTDVVKWRDEHKKTFQEKQGQKLTFTPLFVHAVAHAIKKYPDINASVDGRKIIIKKDINVGMATALPSGNLIVPVVQNADCKTILQLATDVNRLANLARNNKLGGDDIKGGTFTISNVGTFGSLMGTPIINQPEVAILATGIIKKRAEVLTDNGQDRIEIRSMMMLSLSFDHRVVDGFLGGSFLKEVADQMARIPEL